MTPFFNAVRFAEAIVERMAGRDLEICAKECNLNLHTMKSFAESSTHMPRLDHFARVCHWIGQPMEDFFDVLSVPDGKVHEGKPNIRTVEVGEYVLEDIVPSRQYIYYLPIKEGPAPGGGFSAEYRSFERLPLPDGSGRIGWKRMT